MREIWRDADAAGKRSHAGTFLFTFTDEERFCVGYTAIESLISGRKRLTFASLSDS